MDRIKAKLDGTALTAMSVGNFVKDAEALRKKRAIEAAQRESLKQMKRYHNNQSNSSAVLLTGSAS